MRAPGILDSVSGKLDHPGLDSSDEIGMFE